MEDHTMKKHMEIWCDILVKVESFIFMLEFLVIDYHVDFKVSILLGRPFLVTG